MEPSIMKLDRRTRKLYYADFYLSQVEAMIVKTGLDYVELEATVAYPEGGGQEADQGVISLRDGRNIRFIGAKKLYGHFTGLPDFPDVQVEGVIWHLIHPDDQAILAELDIGDEVTVSIDIERRARLSLSHTASHFLYLGVGMHRPDAIPSTRGCHIKSDGARFDFGVRERFTNEQISRIEASANAFIARDAKITIGAHSTMPDARIWHCEQHDIPCGGTHLDSSAAIGMMQVRRKGLGTGKERLSCDFPAAVFDTGRYHK
jgi:Ser-tRNA(Ala) deacylase AlaX